LISPGGSCSVAAMCSSGSSSTRGLFVLGCNCVLRYVCYAELCASVTRVVLRGLKGGVTRRLFVQMA
jgi:hypothetical protein